MDDIQPTPEPTTETTTEAPAPAPADAAPEAAAEVEAQAPVFDWRTALRDVPADELRRHPTFAGIVGSEKQRWQQDWETQQRVQLEADARAKAQADLEEMASRNPVEFADKWLSSQEAQKQQERVAALESNARQAIGKSLGAAFHAIPEWGDIAGDPDALARLASAMQGKSTDEVLPGLERAAAVAMVAEKRANALVEQRLAERIKAERAAWETEAAAQGFRLSDRPDLTRGGRASSADPEPDYRAQPKEWDAWYKRNTRGAA